MEQQGFSQESVDKNIILKCKQKHKRAASSINMKTRELSFFKENSKNNQCFPTKNTESNTSLQFDVASNQNYQQIQPIVEKNKCMICFDKPPDSVLMECGHGGICYNCSLEIWMNTGQCHLCRDEIVQVLQIDLSKDKGSYLEVISSTQMLKNQKICTQQNNYQQNIDIQDQNNQESQSVVQEQHINQQQIYDEENEN
ncbi:hypothetical protein PPERSA_09673 [Pseudocohnilembus persalinus]|uniref:RING-type domain-containing protein n=1 Tax=Pseudocohnilembus persalinus TaxID=266149 RepID=A0A0V0R706_PSEPJ|nr:hypothetical protein PPERSA_09673 [Pseudocohnilembus persalinus]|eukprot:KRX10289.1 hypothetical protein PPERSA_09673 [Pseudocohnilembus persalinus]